jgi:hypothetical protein
MISLLTAEEEEGGRRGGEAMISSHLAAAEEDAFFLFSLLIPKTWSLRSTVSDRLFMLSPFSFFFPSSLC